MMAKSGLLDRGDGRQQTAELFPFHSAGSTFQWSIVLNCDTPRKLSAFEAVNSIQFNASYGQSTRTRARCISSRERCGTKMSKSGGSIGAIADLPQCPTRAGGNPCPSRPIRAQ
jgi:hypothetical protein